MDGQSNLFGEVAGMINEKGWQTKNVQEVAKYLVQT
jgi:hypothetical protein